MNIRKTIATTIFAALASCAWAIPTTFIDSATWSDDSGDAELTVVYGVNNEAAIVTFDVLTNSVSIGGENIVPGVSADSEVWTKIASRTSSSDATRHTIKWRPGRAMKGFSTANLIPRVRVWTVTNPPPYMVVDITEGATTNATRSVYDNIRYYPSEDFVPGGVLGNKRYRQSALLMRKIMAKDIKWTMGSVSNATEQGSVVEYRASEADAVNEREKVHFVTHTNNYYMAVFPITQAQYAILRPKTQYPSWFTNRTARIMCPVEQVSYWMIRHSNIKTADDYTWVDNAYEFPGDPNPNSWLGLLRSRTGVRFDLPGEAQWEWACRAGHGNGCWGDGSAITVSADNYTSTDTDIAAGRTFYRSNADAASKDTGRNFVPGAGRVAGTGEGGTAVCGMYPPNSWGLYDMCGNVREVCLDFGTYPITALDIDYHVNIDPRYRGHLYPPSCKDDSYPPSGATTGPDENGKIRRGGGWTYNIQSCRPAYRAIESGSAKYVRWRADGFRVMCPVEVP